VVAGESGRHPPRQSVGSGSSSSALDSSDELVVDGRAIHYDLLAADRAKTFVTICRIVEEMALE
jgi:hypothetical protein